MFENSNHCHLMKEMQFSAIVMMVLMSSALAILLPKRIAANRVINRSRWLMVAGLFLLAIQFLIQYVGNFRATGVVQAVSINVMFFIPCAALFTLSILNMQRRGQVKRHEWLVWIPVWLIAVGVMCFASFVNHKPLFCDSDCLLRAEIIASIIYGLTQIYYSLLNMREITRMEKVLDNYYDRERRGLLRWIRISILSLTVMALFVPVLIFSNGWPLIAYSLFFFTAIFYMWCCFVRHVITKDSSRVLEAEESTEAEEREKKEIEKSQQTSLSDEAVEHIGKIIQRWIDEGKHLQSGITKPMVAAELQIPIYQLSSWVKASGYDRYTQWITALRIKEAKRLLVENRDWSNEAIADHCGISRTHFQRLFKQETGFSPAEFVEQAKK